MKKVFRILMLTAFVAATFTMPAFAQDSTEVITPATGGGFLQFIKDNWFIVLPALYEFIVRIIPTAKDWSWLNLLKKFIDFLIPNLTSGRTIKAKH